MTRATGSKSSLKFAQESTWGVAPTPTKIWGLNFRSCNLGSTKNLFQSDTINAQRAVIGLADGNKAVQGSIVTDLIPEGLEMLIRHLLGKGTTVTTGSGPYTHVMNGEADTAQGFAFEKSFTGINQYFLYSGVRVNSMNINIIQEGFHDVTFDVIGKQETLNQTETLSSPPATEATKDGYTGYQCTLYADVDGGSDNFVAIGNVVSGSINITNNIETDGYVLGSAFRASAEYGRRECSGDFSMFFEDNTYYDLFLAGTIVSIKFVFSNGTESLTFQFPSVKLGGESPAINSPQGVNMNLNFSAKYDVSAGTDVIVTFVNSVASVPACDVE
jgi:hypothetical protein